MVALVQRAGDGHGQAALGGLLGAGVRLSLELQGLAAEAHAALPAGHAGLPVGALRRHAVLVGEELLVYGQGAADLCGGSGLEQDLSRT